MSGNAGEGSAEPAAGARHTFPHMRQKSFVPPPTTSTNPRALCPSLSPSTHHSRMFCSSSHSHACSTRPSPRQGERARSRLHILIPPYISRHILPPIRAPSCIPHACAPSNLRPSSPFPPLQLSPQLQTPQPCAQSTWQNSRPSCSARR